jgi:tRNA (guanosine-2'-O-)-methyltransferase
MGSLMGALRREGMRVYATSCSETARAIGEIDFTVPCAVVMGNEHRGVDPAFQSQVDGELYIPMYGMIQSFNVSVAAAVILAEASRQRRAVGMYDRPRYSADELEALYEEWIRK